MAEQRSESQPTEAAWVLNGKQCATPHIYDCILMVLSGGNSSFKSNVITIVIFLPNGSRVREGMIF